MASGNIDKSKEGEVAKTPIKTFSFGVCSFVRTSPEKSSLNGSTKILNVQIPFEEGLKLNLAIDECLRKLNAYKRSTAAGRSMGLNLAIHLEQSRITVNEQRIT
jgi:hypothetical protein